MIFIGFFAVSCAQNQVPSDPAHNRSNGENVQRSPDVREVKLPDGGRGLLKTGGWSIPDLTSIEKIDQFKVQGAKTIDGIDVDVDAARYRFEFGSLFLSSQMAAEMGWGDLKVQYVSEYKARDRTFAYMFVVTPVEVNEASNNVKVSRGFVFYFAVYDDDGDGVFETLAIGEPSVTRRLRPHVPAWAAK